MHLVIFEGSQWKTFAPLSLSRPVFALLSGATSLLDKAIRHVQPSRVTLWVRPELEEYCRQRLVPQYQIPISINTPLDDAPALIMSGRAMHMARYEAPPEHSVVVDPGNLVVSAFVTMPGLEFKDVLTRSDRWLSILDLPHSMPQTRLPEHIWDLLNWNEEAIVIDAIHHKEQSHPQPSGRYHAIDWDNIWIGRNVVLGPGCVIDASKGPVTLAESVSVGANSVIVGPCYVGPFSQIAPLSYLRPGTSVGPACRIGGELGNCIIQGYSNKQHAGYLGDSYLGEWVNLGADTQTSNLKNTYGEVSVPLCGTETKSGRRLLGSVIGDHSKTAIGTRLNTGSYIGYCSMIGVSKIAPRYVKSFSWLTDDKTEQYNPTKAAEVMKVVMSRRNQPWTPLHDQLLNYAFAASKEIEKN